MKIETKRNLKDKVWTLHKDSIVELIISTLMTYNTETYSREIYALNDENGQLVCQQGEERCFSTKDELIKWLSGAEKKA